MNGASDCFSRFVSVCVCVRRDIRHLDSCATAALGRGGGGGCWLAEGTQDEALIEWTRGIVWPARASPMWGSLIVVEFVCRWASECLERGSSRLQPSGETFGLFVGRNSLNELLSSQIPPPQRARTLAPLAQSKAQPRRTIPANPIDNGSSRHGGDGFQTRSEPESGCQTPRKERRPAAARLPPVRRLQVLQVLQSAPVARRARQSSHSSSSCCPLPRAAPENSDGVRGYPRKGA